MAMRSFFAQWGNRHLITAGIPADRRYQGGTFVADATNGLKIYRANFLRALTRKPRECRVSVPVQLLVNTEDKFVRPYVYDDTSRWVPRLWRRDVHAGHWLPMSHPQVVAGRSMSWCVISRAARLAGLCYAHRSVVRENPSGTTPLSSRGGSGIGRATALAFAPHGADVVVSDIDEASAAQTAAQIREGGGIASSYAVDVADAIAVERFANQVCADHGVPDVVVNNAGVGVAERSSTSRPNNSTACSRSTWAGWSTDAAPSPAVSSSGAPAGISSMSPRWRPTPR